ncbi:bifunctional [glutamine synthetase] adenylyltransferase/[glutamine synthetase]-adenylyl-L-tyrosine phosphorylase [Lutibaculum baratangense]|uniref:Bifunctional glutamine synthetase adenylyltransferase/adenylyl-removing enzyme n=1 Tax=Lutibaculum baratangense AMV1 TaxID=631454 RepID=V4RHS6_9HYPH|nr:bifunctional [glutamine synthetase] adenylyltransferase/[glutamine synthetase]-adenylyl-L-tyrosine phosphorylase [Lutibaculum baratangense]ESR22820.1 Glutamate-ammonia-ligase adenylyltransferase [Lutibaculum baratangense AMV1]
MSDVLSDDSLAGRLKAAPRANDPSAAEAHLGDVLRHEACAPLKALVESREGLRDFLLAVLDQSPWLRGRLVAQPPLLQETLQADPDARLEALCASLQEELRAAPDQAAAMRCLRRFKTKAAVLIALADLGEVWDVDRVTEAMTLIADTVVQGAVDFLVRQLAVRDKITPGDPEDPAADSGLVVLAMGKHGAGELNFSSDIDLIVFFDLDKAPLGDRLEGQKLFVRLTRDLVKLLGEYTEDGYVFRVDLRLRPDPGATAAAISVEAALQYYESLGQNWERAALLKARPCAGDIEAGQAFLKEIAPFIWRKYMDFAALADVHAMKRQIHAAKGHEKVAVAGHNLKLGRGGIREIEFFAQTQQLVAGGRHHELRVRQTLVALDRLAEGGWINAAERDELKEAYRFLRRLEHRLQMVADEQTHTLPEGDAQLERFARFSGFENADELSKALLDRLRTVQGHYAGLFENAPTLSAGTGSLVFTGGEDDPETLETLSQMGFQSPKSVTAAVRAWHFGRIPATRSARARETLTEIVPALLEALSRSANPDAAFAALERFLNRLPAGVQLFSLLRSNPDMLKLLANILGAAPRLSEFLGRRPRVFASVLEPDFFDELPDEQALQDHLDETLRDARSYEDALDRARIFGQEQAFLIGVRLLSDTLSASDAGHAFSRLADVLVKRLHELASDELAKRHGRVPGGGSAVLAMGKLGSREMSATSDLDLILLYEPDQDTAQSDGERPLAPSQYYARLTQRLVAALSAPTAEGQLYEVDMRLRPSGRAGPVATRVGGFAQYHEKEAWTWEHMALTRARVIAAPPAMRERIEGIIRDILTRERDPETLKRDIAEMRGRIEKEKSTDNPWDLKTVPGGLIDLEFIAQYLQLAHGADCPQILLRETSSVLVAAQEAGLLRPEDGRRLVAAGTLYQSLTQVLRLCVGTGFDPDAAPLGLQKLLLRQADMPDLKRLEIELKEMQAGVREAFERLIGPVVPA